FDQSARQPRRRRAMHRDLAARVEADVGVPREVPAEEGNEGDRRGEGKRGAEAPAREPGGRLRCAVRRLGERRRELRRRPGPHQELVHSLEARSLFCWQVVSDEVAKLRWACHESSPSSRSARRASALLVRVLTVPRGMSMKSAISLWESPLQYASSIS